MRSAVIALAVSLALSAGLLAQTPTTVPGRPATPTPDPQAPGAQNPTPPAGGQTPGAPATSGTAAPKLPSGGENQIFIEIKTGYNNVEIDPNTRGPDGRPTRSFLTPGDNVFSDFTFFQDHSLGGQNRIQFLGIFRTTNDIRVDPEQNSFQRGYLRFTTPRTEINFGDYLVNYSRFTYNQNIKGVHIIRKVGSKVRFLANGGVFTDRWGSIFKEDIIGKPFTRTVAGLRAEAKFTPDKVLGFNFSEGRDQLGSIRRDLRAALQGADNQIVSVDSRMSFGRLFSFDGEIAESSTQPDISQNLTKKADWGARFDTSTRKGPFFLKTTYTRLEPDFLSLNARQLADLQDAGVRAGFDLGSHVTVEGAYRQTSNNLRNVRPDGTTTFRVPEVRLSLRQLPGLGRSIFEVGYRERQQEGPLLAGQKFGQDKNTKIPFVEASIPLGSTLISAGYEHRDNHDGHFADQSSGTNRLYGSLRSIFDIKGWQISPNFRYEIERELFLLVSGANDNRSVLASLYMDAPKYVVQIGRASCRERV